MAAIPFPLYQNEIVIAGLLTNADVLVVPWEVPLKLIALPNLPATYVGVPTSVKL